jgi:hypothetical protein
MSMTGTWDLAVLQELEIIISARVHRAIWLDLLPQMQAEQVFMNNMVESHLRWWLLLVQSVKISIGIYPLGSPVAFFSDDLRSN